MSKREVERNRWIVEAFQKQEKPNKAAIGRAFGGISRERIRQIIASEANNGINQEESN